MCIGWDRRSAASRITDINANMGNAGSIVCANKEDEITGLCVCP